MMKITEKCHDDKLNECEFEYSEKKEFRNSEAKSIIMT